MHKDVENPPPTGKPYAVDEVEFPVLAKSALLLIMFVIFSTVLAGGAYWLFVVHETVPPAHVLEATPTPWDPNVPMLQKDPVAEIHKFRADEYDAVRSYSHWQDGDGKTSLRIPIARAMEIVKATGLPKAVKAELGARPPGAVPVSVGMAPGNSTAVPAAANTSGQVSPPPGPRP